MLIGISGTHGVGKTTFMYELARKYKISHPQMEVEVLREGARRCPLGMLSRYNHTVSLATQLWMFGRQIEKEIGRERKAITVSDRTVFDVIGYTMLVDEELAAEMFAIAMRMEYDKIYFVRPTGGVIEDGKRNGDEEIRRQVDLNLEKIFSSKDINVKEIKIHHMGGRG